jgi:hypothetical protein
MIYIYIHIHPHHLKKMGNLGITQRLKSISPPRGSCTYLEPQLGSGLRAGNLPMTMTKNGFERFPKMTNSPKVEEFKPQ